MTRFDAIVFLASLTSLMACQPLDEVDVEGRDAMSQAKTDWGDGLYGTCEDHCGGTSDGSCYCDEGCVYYGDCCGDFDLYCGYEEEPTGSCLDSCGGLSDSGCYCDDACTYYGDCCFDFIDVCAGEPASTCDAATSCSGNFTINSNADLEAAALCSEIMGTLIVEDQDWLTEIDLPCLTSAEGLRIRSNDSLTKISIPVTELTTLTISKNESLADIDGLSDLTTVWDAEFESNDALTNIDGLSNVSSFASLVIDNNDALHDLDGLHNVSEITFGDLIIDNNDSLVDIHGLYNVTRLGVFWGDLSICNNDSLPNVDGLVNISAVSGSLYINDNDSLVNVVGAHGINQVGSMYWEWDHDGHFVGELQLRQNSSLCQSEADDFIAGVYVPTETITSDNNDDGC
jgi:hypothetical protein